MRTQNQSNALLVELLIVILFFMLGSAILIQVFASSYQMTGKAQVLARAMAQAQNVADTLYASDDPLEALEQLEFAPGSGVGAEDAAVTEAETQSQPDNAQTENAPDTQGSDQWIRQEDGYVLTVTASSEAVEGGTMRYLQVQARSGDEVLITLPCSRFEADAA